MLHHRQVVGNKQISDVSLFLQIIQQIENLRLDRDIQRRDRLIADDEIGIERQSAGDADALPLAAGKFVRISAGIRGIKPDALQQACDTIALFRPWAMPCTLIGSPMMLPTVMRGFRLLTGS